MNKLLTISVLLFTFLFISCEKEQKRRGIDYDLMKKELALTTDQEQQFDKVITQFKAKADQNRLEHTTEGGKLNRTPFFAKMEEINKEQALAMQEILNENQMKVYVEFMEKNGRKRPRYNDELIDRINYELALDETQRKVLEAANNAFEVEFQNAHDIYHGNAELAAEYFEKFDNQRKTAIESVLNETQIEQFRILVKDVQSPSKKQ